MQEEGNKIINKKGGKKQKTHNKMIVLNSHKSIIILI